MTAATRLMVRRWRDPRLLLGVLLVLGSAVAGARVLATRDDTVAIWSVRHTVTAGDAVGRADLAPAAVRLPSGTRSSYLRVDDVLPSRLSELVWSHDVTSGALLEKSAVVRADQRSAAQLPLAVADGAAPDDLRHGDLVDVWVGPAPGDAASDSSRRVLRAVRVVSAGTRDAFGSSSARTVLVGVDGGDLAPSAVSALSAGHVTLVRVAS